MSFLLVIQKKQMINIDTTGSSRVLQAIILLLPLETLSVESFLASCIMTFSVTGAISFDPVAR